MLKDLNHFKEAKSLYLKTMPVAHRVLGNGNIITLTMRLVYAKALYEDDSSTLDDLREAESTLKDTARLARRVLGRTHPTVVGMEASLREARDALRARETPSGNA